MAWTSEQVRTAGVVVLATLAAIAALYLGAELLVPIALAITLATLFRSTVCALERLRLPTSLAAAVVVLGLLAVMTGAGLSLATPVRNWLTTQGPQSFAAAQAKLSQLREPVQKLADAVGLPGPASAPASQVSQTPQQENGSHADVQGPAVHVLGTTTKVLGIGAEVLLLMYLLLASPGIFSRKLAKVLRRPEDRQIAHDVMQESHAVVLRYVGVTAMINLGQAIVVVLAMWWIGMPTPFLWGVFTFVLEFVPYLGALVMIVLLLMTGLATFDSFGYATLAPASYLIISTLQNNLVSPMAYGKGLQLNPVVVLVGVVFWWLIWGIPGAFLSVPIVATMKILADHVKPLRPIGEFLGE